MKEDDIAKLSYQMKQLGVSLNNKLVEVASTGKVEVKESFNQLSRELAKIKLVTESQLKQFRDEFKEFNFKFKDMSSQTASALYSVRQKLGREDGERIWRHFKRCAEYEDLKILYNKCVPVVGKMEKQIDAFTVTVENNNQIIRRFDELLMRKVDKLGVKHLEM